MTEQDSGLLLDLAGALEQARAYIECARLAVEGALQDDRRSNAITTVLEDAVKVVEDVARDVRVIGLGREGER